MAYTVYNFDALTGGGTRALDAISVGDLSEGFRAFGMVDGRFVVMRFNATSTDSEDVVNHPFKVRPDDYSTAGVWVEQVVEGIPFVGENLIINPQFEINQEDITFGAHSADEYFCDQWMGGATGCTVSLSGDILTISAGSVIQPIEDENIPSGTYTLSWEGTASAYIDGGSAQNSPHTFTVSSGTHVEIEFGTGTVQQPVLVGGGAARAFVRPDTSRELIRCQRYFEISANTGSFSTPGMEALTLLDDYNLVVGGGVRFQTRKRITPTIVLIDSTGSSGNVDRYRSSAWEQVSASTNMIATNGFRAFINSSYGSAIRFHWTADARI